MLKSSALPLATQSPAGKPFAFLPPRRHVASSRVLITTAPHDDTVSSYPAISATTISTPVTSSTPSSDSIKAPSTISKPYLGKKAVVVGAGPAGITAAMYLAQRGFAVQVYERRPEPRFDVVDTGRAYIIILIPRGMASLQQLGVPLPSEPSFRTLGSVRHDAKGNTTIMPESGNVTFSRSDLAQYLVNEARRRYPSAISFNFNSTCTAVDLAGQVASFSVEVPGGGEPQAVARGYDIIVGADGVGSQVRHALASSVAGYQYEVQDSGREYKVYTGLRGDIEPQEFSGKAGTTLHLFTSDDPYTTLTAHRNPDGTYSGTFSLRHGGWDSLGTRQQYEHLLATKLRGLPQEWVQQIAQQTFGVPANPVGKRIKCSQLHGPGAILLGDAAHAVTPVFGQGANSALESCQVLGRALEAARGDVQALPQLFDAQRRADAHSLCEIDAKAYSFYSGKGWLDPGFVQLLAHLVVGTALAKLMPKQYGEKPALLQLGSPLPYSEITAAVRRDGVVAAVALGVLAVLVWGLLRVVRMLM